MASSEKLHLLHNIKDAQLFASNTAISTPSSITFSTITDHHSNQQQEFLYFLSLENEMNNNNTSSNNNNNTNNNKVLNRIALTNHGNHNNNNSNNNVTSTTSSIETVLSSYHPDSHDNGDKQERALSKEEILLRERTRAMHSSGISSYVIHDESQRILLPNGSDVHWYDMGNNTLQSIDFSPSKTQVQSDDGNDDVNEKVVVDDDVSHKITTTTSLEHEEIGFAAKMDCKLSPDGQLFSFIANGDLYVYHFETGDVQRLTFTSKLSGQSGAKRTVTAGVAEFIMQEEFDRYTGYWWCPVVKTVENLELGGQQTRQVVYRIAYLEVDESMVPTISIAHSGSNDLTVDEYRYPRPGEPNARSKLKVVSFVAHKQLNQAPRTMTFPGLLTERIPWCEYVLRVGWLPCGESIWMWLLDRKQQRSALVTIDASATNDMNIEVVVEECSDIWINTKQTVHFLKETKGTVGHQQRVLFGQEKNGFNHLYLYERNAVTRQYQLVKPVTFGNDWMVLFDHLWVDETSGTVYFMATKNSVLEDHLYSVSIDGTEPNTNLTRLTPLGMHVQSVTFNHDFSKFVTIRSSKNRQPIMTIHSRCPTPNSHSNTGQQQHYQEVEISFRRLTNSMSFSMTEPKFYSFTNDTLETIYGSVFLPPNYDQNQQYPCVLYVYAGPHVQLVKNAYSLHAQVRCQLLASRGFIVVLQDGRGSFNRGLKFEGYLRCRMGQFELDDQIKGIESLISGDNHQQFKLSIDRLRIGVFGWSYGGYMSLCAMAQYDEFFKVGVAGAPVTAWELYDTGYTERYMDTPDNNAEGYKMGSVLTYVSDFPEEDDRLLIIHGLSDENVHFKHVEVLISQLVKYQKPYQLALYPGERHGVRNASGVLHWTSRMIQFFVKHL